MGDSYVGKMFFAVFAITIAFFTIVGSYMIKMDNNTQSSIDALVQEFVEKSRLSGYISPTSYREFVEGLYQTGYVYDIEMKHESEYAYPESDGTYTKHYLVHSTKDILNSMFCGSKDTNYVMKDGDYFDVKVKNISPSVGQQILAGITGNALNTLRTSYGGYIGNTYR